MSITQIIETARGLDGALVVLPGPGDGTPELAWGDTFFYYAPDGVMPLNVQPYATIVTKNYPGDTASALDGADRWRVNIHVDRASFIEIVGAEPRDLTVPDHAAPDILMPHPVYGSLGWVAVVNPGERSMATVMSLLGRAHRDAQARYRRRVGTGVPRGESGDDTPDH